MPDPLKQQLKIGGRLVIPVGRDALFQELVCITRCGEQEYRERSIAPVRFVPLVSDPAPP